LKAIPSLDGVDPDEIDRRHLDKWKTCETSPFIKLRFFRPRAERVTAGHRQSPDVPEVSESVHCFWAPVSLVVDLAFVFLLQDISTGLIDCLEQDRSDFRSKLLMIGRPNCSRLLPFPQLADQFSHNLVQRGFGRGY
jgi:hypothetical protein